MRWCEVASCMVCVVFLSFGVLVVFPMFHKLFSHPPLFYSTAPPPLLSPPLLPKLSSPPPHLPSLLLSPSSLLSPPPPLSPSSLWSPPPPLSPSSLLSPSLSPPLLPVDEAGDEGSFPGRVLSGKGSDGSGHWLPRHQHCAGSGH